MGAPLGSKLLGSFVRRMVLNLVSPPPTRSARQEDVPPSSHSHLSLGSLTHGAPGPVHTQLPLLGSYSLA